MKIFNRLQSSQYARIAGLLAVDALFFGLTDPMKTTPAVLAMGFALAASTLFVLLSMLVQLARWYGLSLTGRERKIARTGTIIISVLLALQSVGQLSQRDILVFLPLMAVAYLYFSYGRANAQS